MQVGQTDGDILMKSMIEFAGRLDQVSAGMRWIRAVAHSAGLPAKQVNALDLALEEIVTNIIKYGYDDEAEHMIQIDFELSSTHAQLRVMDDAKPFNPLQVEKAQTLSSLEDVKIGGLGILLVREVMDVVEYSRDGDRNVLVMKTLREPDE
ncbi:ATP-binding protein [bacterium]|nr:ATP-binding protein [bacterium]